MNWLHKTIQKILKNNDMFKIQRGVPLFKISYDRIYVEKSASVVFNGIYKNKGIAYGLKWELIEKEPLDIIKFQYITKT